MTLMRKKGTFYHSSLLSIKYSNNNHSLNWKSEPCLLIKTKEFLLNNSFIK